MSLISVNDLTFCYEGSYDNIFEHVSFQIDTDWKLGFTGRNGRGKTTFLNLLLGKYEYRGSITASVHFDYFPFEVEDIGRDTIDILEEISLGHAPWQLLREISLLGMDEGALYRPLSTLSHGERTKALLAALFLKENNFLLIDEPTNHLDMRARDIVRDYLNAKKGFILVSHDRAFLDGCVDHILSINKADITVTKGNFSQWWENKQRQDAFELSENEKLMGEIHHLTDAVRRTAGWSDAVEATKIGSGAEDRGYIGHKAAKMMQRAKAIEKRRENAVQEKSKLLKNIERNENLAVHPLIHRNERLLEIRDLAIAYSGREVLSGFSLELRRGERVALTGPNGCGKSSVVKLVAGEDIPHTGTLRLASGLVISYVPQDTSFLEGGLMDYAANEGVDPSLFLTILRKLDFPRVQFEKDMRSFSAGQRKKVLLAHSLCQQAHLYLWDEPLNYVDVLSRMQIEALIREGQPAMLFVEHDRAFIENTATRVIEL
jgi:lincosamide and streptogramin A transport system ATP-binding/permease protein